ncbi:hypothetical protein [Leucobacter sp. NPDC077196]|uniref:hypothetical protein n=1 Tax=Leucobacter sp. NPDC077196 TaxID=3154959 RepID=UPI0034224941
MEIAGMVGGWGLAIVLALIALLPRKGTIENTRLDQLQEDLAAERAERKELSTRLDVVDKKLDRYRTRDIAWMRHYAMIQHGVETGTIPPWPDLPEALRSDH